MGGEFEDVGVETAGWDALEDGADDSIGEDIVRDVTVVPTLLVLTSQSGPPGQYGRGVIAGRSGEVEADDEESAPLECPLE